MLASNRHCPTAQPGPDNYWRINYSDILIHCSLLMMCYKAIFSEFRQPYIMSGESFDLGSITHQLIFCCISHAVLISTVLMLPRDNVKLNLLLKLWEAECDISWTPSNSACTTLLLDDLGVSDVTTPNYILAGRMRNVWSPSSYK